MIWIAYVIAAIVGVVIAVAVIGLLLPQNREARRSARLNVTVDRAWELMSNHIDEIKWRNDLSQVVRLDDRGNQEVWQEIYKNGNKMNLQTIEVIPKLKMVRRIVDNKQFGGTWTILFENQNQNCKVNIIENSELYNPIFRFFALFMRPGATIDRYLDSAGVALGTRVERLH